MKIKKILLVLVLVFVPFLFTSCEEKIECQVTFDTQGGTTVETITVMSGEKVEKPTDPVLFGYEFDGWFKESSYVNEWDFQTNTITENITLYAKWLQTEISIADALALCEADGYISENRYLVRGTITKITNPTYGAMEITDGENSISVYGTYSADGEKRYSELEEKPYANDEVLLSCILQNYNGSKEIKSGWILEIKKGEVSVDASKYEEMTIAKAREAKEGALIKATGVVARITYANGMIPSGFYLVDETNSIYVYDSQITPQVKMGNKVTILAEKTYWILDTEKTHAETYGYTGCCQLQKAHLVSNDNKTNEFETGWITESTVKNIVDTPVSENISTTIYKVNALIIKVEDKGFDNYYIYDLDGTTGTYTYTQCNGSDFAWLDEFNGKICTVYLSAMNAKSTATGSYWRFLPVKVENNNFQFDYKDACKFAIDYYVLDSFEKEYKSDPTLELLTSVSNNVVNFENVAITYESNNTNVVYFETKDNSLLMHTKDLGTATITIKAKYLTYEYETTIEIRVSEESSYDTITVEEAIDQAEGTKVTLKGVVSASLVNKVGFYLTDSTGTMAVEMESSLVKTLSIGDLVVIEGTRYFNIKSGSTNGYGQVCVNNATILENYYGNNPIPQDSIVKNETVKNLYNLNIATNYSNTIFEVECKITYTESQYSTNYFLTDGTTKFTLYCGNQSQYAWLKELDKDTNYKILVAACNWNSKTYWTGCIISVTDPSGNVVYNTLHLK